MVSADHENRLSECSQSCQELIEQLYRLSGRLALVIDIPGNEYSIRFFLASYPQDLLKYVFLIFDHRKSINAFADMQIGDVKQLHASSSPTSVPAHPLEYCYFFGIVPALPWKTRTAGDALSKDSEAFAVFRLSPLEIYSEL